MSNILNFLKHCFFSSKCIFCNQDLSFNQHTCDTCYNNLDFNKNCCHKCSKFKCICTTDEVYFDKIISPLNYNYISSIPIKDLKFNGISHNANPMSQYMVKSINNFPNILDANFIIPIPMTKLDIKLRGFNQTLLLANCISKLTNIPVNNNVIYKAHSTKKQHNLSKNDRKLNLINAYYCKNPNIIKNKSIIVCDDVATTCATLNQIAYILKYNGAKKINCIVFATTQL